MHLPFPVVGLGWALVAFVIYVLVTSFVTSRRNAFKARELNCLEPPIQKNRLPLGLDQLQRALKADKDRMFPVDTIQRTKDNGAITFKYSMLGSTNYFTADEMNIQAILAKQFKDFELGPNRRGNFFPLFGNGIFTQDLHNGWDHSRSMMRPQFAREQVSDLDLEERHVQNMMRALVTKPSVGGWTDEVDLQVLFFRLTLDSATEFLFGESVDSQLFALPDYSPPTARSGEGPNSERFAYAFDRGQMHLATRARFQRLYALHNPADFRQCCTDVHVFIDHFVRRALSKELREKELEKGNSEKKGKYIFLEALAAETQDPLELRSQLMHILLAGRDTTASLLGWLFFSLARDPDRYAKLRDIIIAEFGTYEEPKEIAFSGLKSCAYLQYCLNESLRLYPVVPVNGRRATTDTTLPRGGGPDGKSKIFVPKGTQVDYSVHVMHHRKDIWGEDVEEFRPERWEGKRVGWEFLPVSVFPRGELGLFPSCFDYLLNYFLSKGRM